MEKKQIIGTFTVAKAYAGLKNQGFSEAELRRIFKGLAKLRPDACTFYPPKGRRSARLVIHQPIIVACDEEPGRLHVIPGDDIAACTDHRRGQKR